MKRLVLSLASLVLAVSSIGAQAAGDAAAGERKSAVCAACHGADGNSELGSNPKLAGQSARYLVKQMTDIKEGNRTVALMTGLLDSMSEQDLEDIAAYYAAQEHTIQGADPELVELGASIYRGGIADLGVAACTACHGPTGDGVAQAGFPSVSGQHAEYTATQLKAFRSGERANDGDAAPMRTVAERLTDREIEALASYMAGLN